MDPLEHLKQVMTRRQFFSRSAWGIGTMALGTLLNGSAQASQGPSRLLLPHLPSRAKRVIYIFRAGGPPQMETFDYKPELVRWHGKPLPASVRGDQRLTLFSALEKELSIVASPYGFSRHGKSGAWVSDLMPHTAGVVDDICFIKSMHTEAINHDPGLTYMMTGSQQPGRPSLGGWVS